MHRIELSKPAAKELEKVFRSDRKLYARFLDAFDAIAKEPQLGKPLQGKLKGLMSHRMGSYRILYETRQDRLLVIVVDLGHRREIYE